ncbi:MAG: hypothetical protein ACYS8X_06495 [Planctomycetota bacterium]|jgi:tetratricopeptide (TPR) repeat protein
MGNRPFRKLVAVALVLAVCGSAASTQDAAGDPAADEELLRLLQQLDPDQLAKLIAEANAQRLAVEREQAIAEIRQGLLYDPDQIDEAAKLLESRPARTRDESILRINQALDMVDQRFAEARRLLAGNKPGEAAVAAKKLLDPHQATVVSAAQHLLYADALQQARQFEEAAEAYGDILKAMPERISFAAAAALRAGASYDRAGRGIYARDMYDYCLTNYALAIEEHEFEQVATRLAELEAIYSDPMAAVAGMMGEARQKLESADSGRQTQQAQREAAAILEDLIRTLEEKNQQNSSNSQSSQRQRQTKDSSSSSEQEQPTTGPSGGDRPTSPMENSRLVPGKLPEPSRLATVHDSDESGDWASLPPRKREAIQQIMRKTMSDRYRWIVSDYHRRLAKEGSE